MVLHALSVKTLCHATGSSPSYLMPPRSAHVVTTYNRGITCVVPLSTGSLPKRSRTAFQRQVGPRDFVISDDNMMNCDEQRQGFCAEGSSSYAGGDDSEMMSTPMDTPREQVVAFFSEEDLKRDQPASSEGSEAGEKTKSSPAGGVQEGGRFDEEPVVPDRPYSPRPKDRGHGIPPHKDETNTGPGPKTQSQADEARTGFEAGGSGAEGERQMEGGSSGSAAGSGHPVGDEQNPAAAI